jgi:hypothetical protein
LVISAFGGVAGVVGAVTGVFFLHPPASNNSSKVKTIVPLVTILRFMIDSFLR